MKRRARPAVPEVRLEDLHPSEVLAFVAAWAPPTTPAERARWRWRTWAEYLAEWAVIKPQWAASTSLPPVTPYLFAERLAAVARDLSPRELQALRRSDVPARSTDGGDLDPAA